MVSTTVTRQVNSLKAEFAKDNIIVKDYSLAKAKEEELLKALGKKAWEDKKAKGIAILTQIGEMSVNISADLMISDVCPIDRLVQRAGRLCRFDKNKVGELHIVVPEKNGEIYPAPYGIYKRPKWTAHREFQETIDIIKEGQSYSAGDFVDLINQIYKNIISLETKSKQNANNLKEYFVNNWLISSKELSKEDAEGPRGAYTDFW